MLTGSLPVARQSRAVTGFGILRATSSDLSLYLPASMLELMPLKPGASAIVEGLLGQEIGDLRVRAKKTVERSLRGRRFTAIVSLPNHPKSLHSFLAIAKGQIAFLSISTLGNIVSHPGMPPEYAEVLLEGTVLPGDTSQEEMLRSLVSKAGGNLIALTDVESVGSVPATVSTSLFVCTTPIFRNSFYKVRIRSRSRAKDHFKSIRDKFAPIRATLDFLTMTISVDLSIALLPEEASSYIIVVDASDLTDAPPVTEEILAKLPTMVNVEAISAFEFVEFDRSRFIDDVEPLKPAGRVEMLITAPPSVEVRELRRQVESACRSDVLDTGAVRVDVQAVESSLTTEGQLFTRLLNNGRYAFIQMLGAGSFGRVNKYFDLRTNRMVAGKHVPKDFNPLEVEALLWGDKKDNTNHIVEILDLFYDDDGAPVIVMEFVQFTLDAFVANPKANSERGLLFIPDSFASFIEMAMQLCDALAWVHGGGAGEDFALLHRDIKPANIGVNFTSKRSVWKLLDFGLARKMALSAEYERTVGISGSIPYLSPQAWRMQQSFANDVYSLGVVFYQILNGWEHPSRGHQAGREGVFAIPEEVEDHISYMRLCERFKDGLDSNAPPPWNEATRGFPRDRWKVQRPFAMEVISEDRKLALKEMVFKMVALDIDGRYQNMQQVRETLDRIVRMPD